ncbi:peptidoglycan -binding protein [Yoonia sp.]|uniref:peptidoglycan -binding protein n=1 Tax=Yoonia sp. TaxID=2212373 RepID=UPI0039189239
MALSRRSSNRFQNAIWPGFVDAMTGILLVLMFVLSIFMVIQFALRDTILGQESELDTLSSEMAALAATLGLAEDRTAALIAERDAQDQALAEAQDEITGFEAQVAGLLADQRAAQQTIAGLEDRQERLISQQEALNLALAQARDEIDESAEAARLAAARREALEAMIADLETERDESAAQISDLEAARLTDAAAAAALRERLENADAELTAMTLNLERQRREAEEALTLLAAARATQDELDAERAEAMTEAERQAGLLAIANATLAEQEEISAEAQRQTAVLNEQILALRNQVGTLQTLLDLAEDIDRDAQVQIETLGAQLNTALARVASEERQRRALEEAERIRLEAEAARLQAEAEDLVRFRSDFFGQLRQVLEGQDRIRIEGDRFVFSSEVLFQVGQADLSPQGRAEIANIAGILRDIADDIPPGIDWIIRVDGHTDDIPVSPGGRFSNNWELSQARALSVVRFMAEDLGIPPTRLAANGFGEYQPLNPANTAEARAQNRRIELKLTER